jgi:hypothetical protein
MQVILSTNRLLVWGAALFAIYFAVGALVDGVWYSVVVSACLFVSGIMVAARAVPDAVQIVKNDQVGPGELAVIGLALLSVGAVWSGGGNMVYAAYGRPDGWIGSTLSLGRAMMALGFFTFFLSPEATSQGVRWPRWYVLLSAAIIVACVSFLAGLMFSSDHELFNFLTTRVRTSDLMAIRRA